jgi:hypothetical protein
MRADNASMSRAVGTPSFFSVRDTRSSARDSSLSHWPVAREDSSGATPAIRLVASASFSSAADCVLRWMARPSFTSESNTLPPSSCALENAPSPASQIWLTDSRTVSPHCAALFFPAAASSLPACCVFLTMSSPSMDGCAWGAGAGCS